ncbi:hypothetical protein RRG08_015799 [Elysia crispata]|uniref:Uncharacterized protein n=1 Tax=Elysia crispata TaxID=231223 RepID=A0AAE1BBL2_9GAST|nr:hypothetical protein RRG08_015799 [Elysia crispata]
MLMALSQLLRGRDLMTENYYQVVLAIKCAISNRFSFRAGPEVWSQMDKIPSKFITMNFSRTQCLQVTHNVASYDPDMERAAPQGHRNSLAEISANEQPGPIVKTCPVVACTAQHQTVVLASVDAIVPHTPFSTDEYRVFVAPGVAFCCTLYIGLQTLPPAFSFLS